MRGFVIGALVSFAMFTGAHLLSDSFMCGWLAGGIAVFLVRGIEGVFA